MSDIAHFYKLTSSAVAKIALSFFPFFFFAGLDPESIRWHKKHIQRWNRFMKTCSGVGFQTVGLNETAHEYS